MHFVCRNICSRTQQNFSPHHAKISVSYFETEISSGNKHNFFPLLSVRRPHIFPKSTAHLPKNVLTSPSNRPNISASATEHLLSARIGPRKASPEYPKAVSERQRKSHISPQSGIARTRVFSYLCTNTLCAHVAEFERACWPARSISHK